MKLLPFVNSGGAATLSTGVGHSGGFSNLIVPGAGEPNYDTMVANPFETRGQRREQEVAQLMDKLPPEMIQLEADAVGRMRAVPKVRN